MPLSQKTDADNSSVFTVKGYSRTGEQPDGFRPISRDLSYIDRVLVRTAIFPPTPPSGSGSIAAGSTVPQSSKQLASKNIVLRPESQPR
ncbi:hypothetical protein [Paraburkholderia sp. BL6665CI2N2]|uniref:hypothetical protein n=1 Tax=Paraburkholderia sp. BL6665CI2N2 TaxID=1938806 RepID=UPI0010657013|nr:hypothetical protein [Paraburkholderia sp. BL6665CI2N2]